MSSAIYNPDKKRYEMAFGNETVFANVRRDGDILHIDYVEAPVALRGTGAASAFMTSMMENIRADDLKVIPLCGYAASWLQRHEKIKI
jgi:predicted GNAT family acetyltransferase